MGLDDLLPCASVPLSAAARDKVGEGAARLGGANLRRGCNLDGFIRVGDRPAAETGADRGVAMDFVDVSTRGVYIVGGVGGTYNLVDGTIFVLRAFDCFASETSSSKNDRLRLAADSKAAGSMFSESESSGDGALLFKFGAE